MTLLFSSAGGPTDIHGWRLAHRVFEGSTVKDAADFFSAYLDRPVIDRTGLDGEYNFTFEFKPDPRMSGAAWKDVSAGWLPLMAGFDAARLAAGLDALDFALESTTAPFEVLLIDAPNYEPTGPSKLSWR